MKKKDTNLAAVCDPAVGEAGKTGDWRSLRPVIVHDKCIPFVNKEAGLLPVLVVCPEGVVKAGIPWRSTWITVKVAGFAPKNARPRRSAW